MFNQAIVIIGLIIMIAVAVIMYIRGYYEKKIKSTKFADLSKSEQARIKCYLLFDLFCEGKVGLSRNDGLIMLKCTHQVHIFRRKIEEFIAERFFKQSQHTTTWIIKPNEAHSFLGEIKASQIK